MSGHLSEPRDRDKAQQALRSEKWHVGGYTAAALAFFFTLLWVGLQYLLIGWRGRDWEFGTLPYVPGESAFVSSYAPNLVSGGRQIELPTPVAAQPPNAPGGSNAAR